MKLKLEVVVLPVSDVDVSREFYEALGFRLDADFPVSEKNFRVVQLTPPGSECSIIFGDGVTVAQALGISEVFHDADGVFHHAGTENRVTGPHPKRADYGSFATFSDPDGNGWVLQEVKVRAPGR